MDERDARRFMKRKLSVSHFVAADRTVSFRLISFSRRIAFTGTRTCPSLGPPTTLRNHVPCTPLPCYAGWFRYPHAASPVVSKQASTRPRGAVFRDPRAGACAKRGTRGVVVVPPGSGSHGTGLQRRTTRPVTTRRQERKRSWISSRGWWSRCSARVS